MENLRLPLQFEWHPASELQDPRDGHLIVVLHGRGDSPEGFHWMKDVLQLPKCSYLLLQAPDPYYVGFSWYDLPPNQLPGILRSRKLLEELFDELDRSGFKLDKTFLFGFSQGCLMTLEFGARYSKELAGYIGVSGYCYDPDLLAKEANPKVKRGHWLVTHGTNDEVLTIERTRDQINTLNQSGFKIEYQEYSKGHTIDDRDELPAIKAWILKRF